MNRSPDPNGSSSTVEDFSQPEIEDEISSPVASDAIEDSNVDIEGTKKVTKTTTKTPLTTRTTIFRPKTTKQTKKPEIVVPDIVEPEVVSPGEQNFGQIVATSDLENEESEKRPHKDVAIEFSRSGIDWVKICSSRERYKNLELKRVCEAGFEIAINRKA